MKLVRLAAAAALVLAVSATSARADDIKATARTVAQKTQKAIVTARIVLKITTGESEREQKLDVTGTMIDASGLTVVPAAAVEPTSVAGRMGGGGDQMRVEAEISETLIVLEDGTELESDVVLKDADLDLAFIRPRDTKGQKLDFVDLKAGATAQMLDDVFVVGRLGRVANRAVSVSTGTVKSVVKGPRSFYICDSEVSSGNLGCLVYAADGSALGIFVTRTVRSEGAGGGAGFRGRGETAVVVRPVADLMELAKQALAAKAPEKKKTDGDEDGEKKSEKKDEKKDDKKPTKPDEKKKGDDF